MRQRATEVYIQGHIYAPIQKANRCNRSGKVFVFASRWDDARNRLETIESHKLKNKPEQRNGCAQRCDFKRRCWGSARLTADGGKTSVLARVFDQLWSVTDRIRARGSGQPESSRVDELFEILSARITADAVKQRAHDWPTYFSEVRILILRIVGGSKESHLSDEEKIELTRRLVDHVEGLEKLWSLGGDPDDAIS